MADEVTILEDEPKRCLDCGVNEEINKLGLSLMGALLVEKECFPCKWSKRAAEIIELRQRRGDDSELADNWRPIA